MPNIAGCNDAVVSECQKRDLMICASAANCLAREHGVDSTREEEIYGSLWYILVGEQAQLFRRGQPAIAALQCPAGKSIAA